MQPSELGDVNIFSIFVDFDFFTISSFQEFFSECSPFFQEQLTKRINEEKLFLSPEEAINHNRIIPLHNRSKEFIRIKEGSSV